MMALQTARLIFVGKMRAAEIEFIFIFLSLHLSTRVYLRGWLAADAARNSYD